MPSAKILEQKKLQTEELTEKIKKAQAGVIVSYAGITVEQDTALRAQLRKAGVEYRVYKNSMTGMACENAGYGELKAHLTGMNAIATCDSDPVAPAKIIKEYADKLNGRFEIKGGFMDGKVISLEEVNALASIPALPVLQAQVLGTMLAPITSFAVVIKAIAEKLGGPVEAEAAAE